MPYFVDNCKNGKKCIQKDVIRLNFRKVCGNPVLLRVYGRARIRIYATPKTSKIIQYVNDAFSTATVARIRCQ